MTGPVPYDPDEEAVVRRIRAQNARFAELDLRPRAYAVTGPVTVTVAGEVYRVPLTAHDIRAALPSDRQAEFEEDIASATPHVAGPVLRKWALETIPGDPLDRVDVLLEAERQAAGGPGTAAG